MRDRLDPIPTAPWSLGDLPKKGRVHVDIVTGGRSFGPVMCEDDPTVIRQFDQILEFEIKVRFNLTIRVARIKKSLG